jgi:hypothetical protein
MPSHFPSAAPFPTSSPRRLQLLEQVQDPAAEDSREVAEGGRVERKSRIGDYGVADHAPIQEVCGLARVLADFIGESRANDAPKRLSPDPDRFCSLRLQGEDFRVIRRYPHPDGSKQFCYVRITVCGEQAVYLTPIRNQQDYDSTRY